MSRNKAKGTAWESAIVAFLRERGFPHVERRALSGRLDKGDIAGLPSCVVEAKSVAAMNLSGWLNEAEQERDNADAEWGVVWLKRRGHTSPGRAYVILSGDDFADMLRCALDKR